MYFVFLLALSLLSYKQHEVFTARYGVKGKSKGYPRTGHEGPEGEQRYSSKLSLISALDGVGGQRHVPAALPPGKTWYSLYRTLRHKKH
jgi:hypothetical protein